MHDAEVISLTCDGPSVQCAMLKELGANLSRGSRIHIFNTQVNHQKPIGISRCMAHA